MAAKDEVLKYIQNEKDISKYKISTLERINNISRSQKRILNIEKEFLTLPLETMNFEDIADVAAAISIYNTSRSLFYASYNIRPPEFYHVNKISVIKALNKKIDFIRTTGYTLAHTRVQELNLVQNFDFHYDFVKRQSLRNRTTIEIEQRQLDALGLDELLNLEPLTIAKKRARAQAVTYSIGIYLLNKIGKIFVDASMTLEALREANEELDAIVTGMKYNIFRYYNEGLKKLPALLDGTMGENPYLSKLHELQNILDFSTLKRLEIMPRPIYNPAKFNFKKPVLGNVFFGSKKAIVTSPAKDSERNIQNKVFGILLPIPRKGNEKMTLLYKNIIVDELNISHLFSDNISNIKALRGNEEIYYKGILMFPLWRIIQMASTDNTSRYILSKIINFKKSNFQDINFNNISIINEVNNIHGGFIEVSEESEVLAAKTRSEEDGLSDIFSIINLRVSEIKDDYMKLAKTTNEIFLE